MQFLLERDIDWFEKPNMSWLVLLGRTKPGVSRSQVRADHGRDRGPDRSTDSGPKNHAPN